MSKNPASIEVEETLNRIQNHKGVVGYSFVKKIHKSDLSQTL